MKSWPRILKRIALRTPWWITYAVLQLNLLTLLTQAQSVSLSPETRPKSPFHHPFIHLVWGMSVKSTL